MSDYWENEHKQFQKQWDKSRKRKFIVTANYGGGLWEDIIEVRQTKMYEDDGFYDRDGDVGYEGDRLSFGDGCVVKGFDTLEDAQMFLEGAKFFRTFMCQFFVGKANMDE